MIEWAFAAAGRFLWFICTIIVRAVADVMFGTVGSIVIGGLVLTAIAVAVVVVRMGSRGAAKSGL